MRSRRLVDGSRVVALHVNDRSLVEQPSTSIKVQTGSFKLGGMPIGTLKRLAGMEGLPWAPAVVTHLDVGDVLILAEYWLVWQAVQVWARDRRRPAVS